MKSAHFLTFLAMLGVSVAAAQHRGGNVTGNIDWRNKIVSGKVFSENFALGEVKKLWRDIFGKLLFLIFNFTSFELLL
jgi:hypothetical protein